MSVTREAPNNEQVAKSLHAIHPQIDNNKLHNFRLIANHILNLSLGSLFEFLLEKNDSCQQAGSLSLHCLVKLEKQMQALGIDSMIVAQFIGELPCIKEILVRDAQAILDGDPAAKSLEEVLLCYPGFYAICVHRLAHSLNKMNQTLLARFIAEISHMRTGIDIHPGASIGQGFCIDHGTGIVIGETTIIGSNVKLYHGVTLGGLSVLKSLASKKRHPTIEDDVVIYSNAVILGGDTVIGKGSIVGGNVWLTHSVEENSLVEQEKQQLSISRRTK